MWKALIFKNLSIILKQLDNLTNQNQAFYVVSEDELQPVFADPFSSSDASSGKSTSDSGRYSPNETVLSDTWVCDVKHLTREMLWTSSPSWCTCVYCRLDSSSSEWMDVSVEKSDCDAVLYKSHCSMSVCSVASTFLPSLPPDSFSTTSTTHIGKLAKKVLLRKVSTTGTYIWT